MSSIHNSNIFEFFILKPYVNTLMPGKQARKDYVHCNKSTPESCMCVKVYQTF